MGPDPGTPERKIPAPFKVFRPLRLAVPKGLKEEVRWRNDKRGVYGIELRIGGKSCIDFDFSDWIAQNGTVGRFSPTAPLRPVQMDESRVGIQGIQAASMPVGWYDKAFTPGLIIEGWRRHGSLIPFDAIVPHLIHRDVLLMHDYFYTCMFPSWDVCLTLPAYLYLCEGIPGFKTRLLDVTELGDQIRKTLKTLSARSQGGEIRYRDLEHFLEKLHAFEDELSLALSIHRAGYDVRFGERGGPDLYVNSIPCEQKSRFPTTGGGDIEVKVPEHATMVDFYRLLILEVKQAERALRKSRMFFNNLSRTGAGMAYTEAVDQGGWGLADPSVVIVPNSRNLGARVRLAMDLQREWDRVIFPYTRYAGPEPRYTIPIPIPYAKYHEATEMEHGASGDRLTDRSAPLP